MNATTHVACPSYPGQWYAKITGACSCGASHGWEQIEAARRQHRINTGRGHHPPHKPKDKK